MATLYNSKNKLFDLFSSVGKKELTENQLVILNNMNFSAMQSLFSEQFENRCEYCGKMECGCGAKQYYKNMRKMGIT